MFFPSSDEERGSKSPFGFSRRTPIPPSPRSLLGSRPPTETTNRRLTTINCLRRRLLLSKKRWGGLAVITLLIYAVHRWRGHSSTIESLSRISSFPLPVHHDPALIDYRNSPVSPHRPSLDQFTLDASQSLPSPIIAIITATQNPRSLMLETYASLKHQSLQNWEWVIIDDHSDQPESLELLRLIAKDPRVTLIANVGAGGLGESRNLGFDYALNKTTIPTYLSCLDDDDLFELTALEKAVWTIESNSREWDMVGFPFVKFAAQNTTEWRGFHSGKANYDVGNFIANSAVFKSQVLLRSGCRYNTVEFPTGGEDWDLWMCFASAGFWGGQIPELLYWYRVNSSSFRQSRWGSLFINGFSALHAKIKLNHPSLAIKRFPIVPPRSSNQLEPMVWHAPYVNQLSKVGPAIMFVLPWLYVGGADIGAMRMIQLHVEAGYRVTVVCTLYKNPEGLELRPYILQLTHDVHVLPSFLRVNDFPRYIKYLIESRGIKDVIISNSQYVYEALPALAEQLPSVKFIDYLHNEAYDNWKSGGYPNYSVLSQRYLARTITCSSYLRRWIVERGHDAARIGVVKLGIESGDFTSTSEADRNIAKRTLLDIGPDTVVISVVARLDPQKRSNLVPFIADELRNLGVEDFLIIMLGDGPLEAVVRRSITSLRLNGFVRLLGTIIAPQDYLAATDIFLLPSVLEGISVAAAEAMASGVPVVTARAGALPEQLGDDSDPSHDGRRFLSGVHRPMLAGVLVNHTLVDSLDARLYAHELSLLIHSPSLREAYGRVGLAMTSAMDWRTTLAGMFGEVAKAQNMDMRDLDRLRRLPNPSAYLSGQTMVMQAKRETDLASHYPN